MGGNSHTNEIIMSLNSDHTQRNKNCYIYSEVRISKTLSFTEKPSYLEVDAVMEKLRKTCVLD